MEIQVCSNHDPWGSNKISRTTESILRKLGTNHSWVKGIQVCSNEGPVPHQRGDNHDIAKIM